MTTATIKTATEMRNEEAQKIYRHAQYERLVSRVPALRKSVDVLEAEAAQYDTSKLTQIRDLSLELPPTILTAGVVRSLSFSLSEFMVVRDLLQVIANAGLDYAGRREQERVVKLEAARKELATAEEQLATVIKEIEELG